MNQAEELKYLVMCYWRFARGHYMVATEYQGGNSDVISLDKTGWTVCETEIKISIPDLKKEAKKQKHTKDVFGKKTLKSRFVHEFYFAMPARMTELDQVRLIIDGKFPYAGILAIDDCENYLQYAGGVYTLPPVKCVKRPTPLAPIEITKEEIMRMAKGMSNSYCNLAFKYMRLSRGLNENNK
jgi:hypothetical protein